MSAPFGALYPSFPEKSKMQDNYLFWLGREGEEVADELERAEFAHLCSLMCPVIEEGDDG